MNRTARPLPARSIKGFADLGLLTKQLIPAVLAQVAGSVKVAPSGYPDDETHFGKYWIRFKVGSDADGNSGYSQTVPALNHATDVRDIEGFEVLVYRSLADGGWIIAKANYRALNRAGFDTRQLNPNESRHKHIALRQIRNGRLFAPATSQALQKTVSVEALLYLWDGQLKNAQQDQSIDLSGSIPSAGNERLTLLALTPTDNSIQVIDGATRSLTTAKYALSDTDALVAQLEDYTLPLGAYQLGDAQAGVDDSDLAFDARQFVNVQQPRGWPQPITRHTHLLANYQVVVHGKQTIEPGGVLRLSPDSDYRIIPTPAGGPGYVEVTTAYSIATDDKTIGADTSSGSFTITLPTATDKAGREYRVKKLSSGGTVTVATTSSQTIDRSATAILTTQDTAVVFVSTGSNWIIG